MKEATAPQGNENSFDFMDLVKGPWMCFGKQALQKEKKKESPEPKVYTNVSFYGISSHHRQLQVTSLTPSAESWRAAVVQATDVHFENLWYRASMEKLRKANEMFPRD